MAATAERIVECDPCQNRKAMSFCTECREFYCTECSSKHRTLTATMTHTQISFDNGHKTPAGDFQCDQCRQSKKNQPATSVCVECRELYCQECTTYHRKIKATKNHSVFQLHDENKSDTTKTFQQLRFSSPEPNFSAAQVRMDTVVGKNMPNITTKPKNGMETRVKVAYCTKFSSRIPSDTKDGNLEVQRMLTLPADLVMVLDSVNNKLKMFSADYKIIHYCEVEKDPRGLTQVDATTVAVSCDHKITMYTLHTDKIQKFKTINCDDIGGDICDISYKDNRFVCLIYHNDNKWCIDVLDMKGQSKTIITENSEIYRNNHIVTGDNNCFYVTTGTDKVRCLALDGRQLWEVLVPSGPCGMTLAEGRLFVVRFTGDVLQISLDGNLHDDPILQGLARLYCICYQRNRSRILLSNPKPGSSIKVYQVN